MRIRPGRVTDIPTIQRIALRAWRRAYASVYSVKSIERTVARYYATPELARELRSDGFFRVADDAGDVTGYAQLGRIGRQWELLRIYVDPNHQRSGVGKRLLAVAERWLRARGVHSYVAYPHARNPIACAFYERRGFHRDAKRDRSRTSICYRKSL